MTKTVRTLRNSDILATQGWCSKLEGISRRPGWVPWMCDLCSHTGLHAQRVLSLVKCSTVTILKFLMNFKQGALIFILH